MYKEGFYITEPVGNNAFSFDTRKNKKIWVPAIINATHLEEIELQNDAEKIAFEDFGFDDILSTNYGLKNFYRFKTSKTSPQPSPLEERELVQRENKTPLLLTKEKGLGDEVQTIRKNTQKEVILFDNHNHALYFWYEAFHKGIIGKNTTVIHVDEHADTRDNEKYITSEVAGDLQKIFEFTNFVTNVGDYILPAIHEGLVGKVVQIRNTQNLEDYIKNILPLTRGELEGDGVVLNLDLDFFQPDLDFIDYDLKKQVVLDAFEKADVITVCTSPFFIDQKLAIRVFTDIFGEYL